MRKDKKRTQAFFGALGFFFLNVMAVMTGVLVYAAIADRDYIFIAIIMIVVILALALVCTLFDVFRRRSMVDIPALEISEATRRIASGDFSVRMEVKEKGYFQYDEFSEIKANINKMAAELSENEVLKTDFVSNVSHQMKTPLTVIQNYSMLLGDPSLEPEKRKEYSDTLMKAAKRLNDFIVNILKLNKLEHLNTLPVFERVDMEEVLENVILQHEYEIEKKNLSLDVDTTSCVALSEPTYLEIIYANLISNAIKFSPEGGKLIIKLMENDDNIVFSVKDEGPGMDEKTLRHIYEKFYQGDKGKEGYGNGLGLAMAKKAAEILGGSLEADSVLGQGSTFTFILGK